MAAEKKRRIASDQRRVTREQRSVSFTKRRQGLYNKAAELCLLCDAQVAIVVSSPCSGKKLYSFGHSSVDAVFDAFLEGGTPDDAVFSQSAVSLYEEVKALEFYYHPDERSIARKRMKKSEKEIDEFWREIEVLEKNCGDSVDELQDLVDNLEKFKEKSLDRLMMKIMSSTSSTSGSTTTDDHHLAPSSSSSSFSNLLTNSASDNDFGAITEYNTPNCNTNGVSDKSDFINVDENYAIAENNCVGDDQCNNNNNVEEELASDEFGTVTDSISHLLDSFIMVDDEGEDLFGSLFDFKPDDHQDQPPPPQHIAPP
ncbi:hypothetical protein Dsin_009762 [Dipteronia sinensis]|uniref:MADS-box domain-containing protein n=1 Tax=Dipteronia sinensis TaxID=43782 RepID=A0AAE0ARG6_9ROSI|nr:hypothetical protein Dsin_009762 [Dipteronia sinensis]